MKPSAADFRFWEAVQARSVPSWVRAIDARRTWHAIRYGDPRIAAELHAAINMRAGWNPFAGLDARNAFTRLEMQRAKIRINGHALAARRSQSNGGTGGFARVTTLAAYMETMASEWPYVHGKANASRATVTYLRTLRRMRKAGVR